VSAQARQTLPLAPRSMRAEAAAWIAKLHGPERSAELEADFKAWLRADPQHAKAFENITDVWDSLGSVNVGGLPRLAASDDFHNRYKWPRLAAAAACVAVAGGALWLLHGKSYETRVGEQRVVSLEDGTRVSLNSSTQIEVDYGQTERQVRLDRGEAFFEVVAEPSRPFVVLAGDRRVRALGTSFVVRYEADRLAVTLLEGKVAVEGEQGEGSVLAPGQRFMLARRAAPTIDAAAIESAVAWRRGEVILDDTPLGEAVAEMNRYERVQIVLDDSKSKDFSVSGIYKTGDGRGFARAVALAYGLEVIERDGAIHLSAR
jgi:transmembrane sensor